MLKVHTSNDKLTLNLSLTAEKTNLNGRLTCSLAQFQNKKMTFPANEALNLT